MTQNMKFQFINTVKLLIPFSTSKIIFLCFDFSHIIPKNIYAEAAELFDRAQDGKNNIIYTSLKKAMYKLESSNDGIQGRKKNTIALQNVYVNYSYFT